MNDSGDTVVGSERDHTAESHPSWIERECRYWEAAHDRVMKLYLEVDRARAAWQSGHEKILAQLQKTEQWYHDLKQDYERRGQRLEEFVKEVEELIRVKQLFEADNAQIVATLQTRDRELIAALAAWEAERSHLVATLQQRDKELVEIRNTLKEDNAKLISVLNQRDAEWKWRDAVLRHPFWYMSQFMKNTLKRIRKKGRRG